MENQVLTGIISLIVFAILTTLSVIIPIWIGYCIRTLRSEEEEEEDPAETINENT